MKYIIYDEECGYGEEGTAWYFGQIKRIDMLDFATLCYHNHQLLGYYKWIEPHV